VRLQQADCFNERAPPIAPINPQIAACLVCRIEQTADELLADHLGPFVRPTIPLEPFQPVQAVSQIADSL
jgi:hypothetical protein